SIRMQPKQAFPEYIKIRLILIMFEKRYHAKLFKMELYLRNVRFAKRWIEKFKSCLGSVID
ncbi:MAG: hypothetical protein RBT65_04990, partial [Methanolobus sp.]|nr:hypothetical protein [Methanolobus sp.]